MTISYNNKSDYDSISYLSLSEIPNILKVSENVSGSFASLDIDLQGNLQSVVTANGEFYVTFLGETITSIMSPSLARNKSFYISSDEDSTAYSMAQAFRNCASLAAQFNIIHEGCSIHFVSKTIGSLFDSSNFFDTNIDSQYITVSSSDGSADSILFNGKVSVDVYKSATTAFTDYVTTLQKNFYGDECAFDVSPVLATFSEYGKATPFTFVVNAEYGNGARQGDFGYVGSVSGYTTIGYRCNDSEKVVQLSNIRMAMHNERGGNEIKRYVYRNTIPYSVLVGSNVSRWLVSVSVKDSALSQIWSSSTYDTYGGGSRLIDKTFTVPSHIMASAYYVDITIGSSTVRFNVIKPLKATEYYQRVEWRNEYGGISFFDFTSTRTESEDIENDTYVKNIFDYQEDESFEEKKIYKNNFEKTVTLTSHLIEKEGTYIFNSLMKSKKIWTYKNGVKQYIIPQNVNVEEDGNYNNIYKVTIQFIYSDSRQD